MGRWNFERSLRFGIMGVDLIVIDDVDMVEFHCCGVSGGILVVVGNGLKRGAYEKEASG